MEGDEALRIAGIDYFIQDSTESDQSIYACTALSILKLIAIPVKE